MRLATSMLHRRMQAHHKSVNQVHITGDDINSFLLLRLDEVAQHDEDIPEMTTKMDYSLIDRPSTKKTIDEGYYDNRQHVVNRDNIKELSNYFKERSKGANLHPAISVKLEHSTWAHIHEAIRCTRCNDQRCAKMHVNIASHAAKELSHYMDPKEHKAFIVKIEEYFDVL
jgi:hypothetical protein